MPYQPKFTISNRLTNSLAKIERARGFLEAAQLSAEWVDQMQNHALLLEAHHTTHIEGTQLTLDQAKHLLRGEQAPGADPDDIQELLNYRDAFEFLSNYLDQERPITEGVIREIHKQLVSGVRGGAAAPGEYRKVQNYVENSMTNEVIYTPPAANEIPRLMSELIEWIRADKTTSSILVAGIAQFQFVNIHPFLDGNGRTARLLSTLCLYQSGYDFKRLFSLSQYYDRDRQLYYQAIQGVRDNDMDLTAWLEYFVEGLETQLMEVQRSGKLTLQLDVWTHRHKLNERQIRAIQHIQEHGLITINELESLCPDQSRRTLQRDLKALVDLDLLRQSGATSQLLYKLSTTDSK